MNTYDNIRIWIAKRILSNQLKKTFRTKKTCNLSSAKSIDILFDATDVENFQPVKILVDKLQSQHKVVNALGYVNNKVIPQQFYLIKGFDFFCKKDTNLFFIPGSDKIEEFIHRKTDIFIELRHQDNFVFDYITALKNSAFKIGVYTDENSNLDMMIDVKNNHSFQFLIEQIEHYLSIIKSKTLV